MNCIGLSFGAVLLMGMGRFVKGTGVVCAARCKCPLTMLACCCFLRVDVADVLWAMPRLVNNSFPSVCDT